MNRPNALIFLSYAAVYIIWGSTYFFIRVADATIPVLHILAIRWTLAGVLFVILGFLTRGRDFRLNWTGIASSSFLGLFLILGGNGLVVLAEKNTDSYLAALILSASPLIVALFDRLFWKKRISFLGLVGIIIGIFGVALLLFRGKSGGILLSPGIILILFAALFWSFATSMGHRMKVPSNAFMNTGIQMLIPGLLALIGLFLVPGGEQAARGARGAHLQLASWSGRSISALLYLTVFGSLGFMAYTYLIKHEPAIRIMTYSFVNPMIAMLLGFFLGLETPVPLIIPAVILILAGLALQFIPRRASQIKV